MIRIIPPTNNLKRYFDIRLTSSLADKNIYLKQNFITSSVLPSDKELDKITHPVSTAIDDVLKNSSNLVSETTAKLAGGKAYNDRGSDLNDTLRMDNNFYIVIIHIKKVMCFNNFQTFIH